MAFGLLMPRPATGSGPLLSLESFTVANANPSTASVAVAVPSGTQEGDLIIAILGHQATTPAFTLLSGWTNIRASATGLYTRVMCRTYTASDGSSYTFTLASSVAAKSVILLRIPAAVLDSVGTISTTSPPSPASVSAAGGLLIGVFRTIEPTASWTAPAGMSQQAIANTISNICVFSERIAAGDTGARTATPSPSGTSQAMLFTVKAP